MYANHGYFDFSTAAFAPPDAWADLRGSAAQPHLQGKVLFHQTPFGVLVTAQVQGLPTPEAACFPSFFAFHIHSGRSCTGSAEDPFADADGHYNPHNCPHPAHAGDLPPLLGANGQAFASVLTDRLTVEEIIGKTVIIHALVDDFTSQPAGNAGAKIACGVIRPR